MKKFLLATAAVLAMTSTASAIDLGPVQLETAVVNEYSTATEKFTSVVTPRISYTPVEKFYLYSEVDVNLYDGDNFIVKDTALVDSWSGLVVGAEYSAIFTNHFDATAYATGEFDNDFDHVETIVGVKLNF